MRSLACKLELVVHAIISTLGPLVCRKCDNRLRPVVCIGINDKRDNRLWPMICKLGLMVNAQMKRTRPIMLSATTD
jgi:hypothetical protein